MAKKPDAAEGIQKPAQKKTDGKPQGKKASRTFVSADELPRRTLRDSLAVPRALHETYAGKWASWEEIASVLGVAASNANNKYPLWAAEAYGVIKKGDGGSYSLTENGRRIVAPTYPGEDKEATVQAILTPAILGRFYADYNGNPVPPDENLLNLLETRYGVPRDRRQEAAATILDNARDAAILSETEDGKRSISLDAGRGLSQPAITMAQAAETVAVEAHAVDYSKICFFITPIGKEDSEERKHSDMMLKHLIGPVLKDNGLEVVRADKIGKPGLITQQVIDHLARSRLCIADLSFHNPSAFYEIGVRHTFLLPTIQIIRKIDTIPFDVAQGRTITVDTSDVYTIMDRFASAREELKEHVTHALGVPKSDAKDNPISYYLAGLKVVIPPP